MSRTYQQQRSDAIGSPEIEERLTERKVKPEYVLKLHNLTTLEQIVLTGILPAERQRFELIAERAQSLFGGYAEWQMLVEEV
jgi:hypothetical protein